MDPEQEDTQRKMDESPNKPPPKSPGEEVLDMQETLSDNQANAFDQVHASIADVTGQLRELATTMEQSALAKDSKTSLHRLHKEVVKLTKFEYPETRTIGFIGTTGVGKSSVVNSILDETGLARSNDDIKACTCVTVEYRAVDETHNQPYTVEVDYMEPNEMRDVLWDHLQNIRQYYFKVEQPRELAHSPAEDSGDSEYEDDEDTEDDEDKLTRKELVKLEREKKSADLMLEALFKGDAKLDKEFLVRSDSADAEKEILDTLLRIATEGLLDRPGGPDAIRHTEPCPDLGSCKDLLDFLTTNPRGDEPAIWPFVKLIRVYLDSPILKTGLVLADMPGLKDMNYARQEATERYIKSDCHILGFVTRMTRCTSDETIEEVNWKTWTEVPAIVVVTRSEEFSGSGCDRGDTDDDHLLQCLDDRINEVKDRAEELLSLMESPKCSGRRGITREYRNLMQERKQIELDKLKFRIGQRNKKTVAEMARMRSRKNMTVFCVSNKLFSENRNEEDEEQQAYAKLSEIPELRRFCHSIIADLQINYVSKFFTMLVPGTLSSVDLWADGAFNDEDLERAASISDALAKAEKELITGFTSDHGLVESTRIELERMFKRRVLKSIDESHLDWENHCKSLCREWMTWRHGTFTAACRKHGIHTSAAYGKHNWNGELIEPTLDGLKAAWDEFMHCLMPKADEVAEAIANQINQIRELLQAQEKLSSSSRAGLVSGIQYRQLALITDFRHTFQKVAKKSELLKANMLDLKKNKTALITTYMAPAYKSATGEHGTGSDKRRKATIQNQILGGPQANSRGLIANYSLTAEKEFAKTLKPLFKSLQKKTSAVVELELEDLRVVAAKHGQIPEAANDPQTARDVREKARVILDALKSVQAVLRELENKGV